MLLQWKTHNGPPAVVKCQPEWWPLPDFQIGAPNPFPQFGGKLVTFENPPPAPAQSPQPTPRQVFVSQVTTETEFLQRSRELQAALLGGTFVHYCQAKIQSAPCDAEQDIWKFLMVGLLRSTVLQCVTMYYYVV